MLDGKIEPAGESASLEPEAPVKKLVRRPVKRRVLTKALAKEKAPREQSSISFPYSDLDAAVSVARAMIEAGGVALSREQLAGVTGLSVGSGNFFLRVAAARSFGLVAINQGKYELTPLGFEVVGADEKMRRGALAKAFLAVPLYQRTYEEFKGKPLPPRPHGLEQAFVRFGVAVKQRTNARLAFDRSAKQAGFFDNGPDRLVEPIIGGVSLGERSGAVSAAPTGGPTSQASRILQRINEDRPGYHPFIQGLLDTLPEPNTNWAIEGRGKWLQAAAHIFELIYMGDGTINVSVRRPAGEGSTPTE